MGPKPAPIPTTLRRTMNRHCRTPRVLSKALSALVQRLRPAWFGPGSGLGLGLCLVVLAWPSWAQIAADAAAPAPAVLPVAAGAAQAPPQAPTAPATANRAPSTVQGGPGSPALANAAGGVARAQAIAPAPNEPMPGTGDPQVPAATKATAAQATPPVAPKALAVKPRVPAAVRSQATQRNAERQQALPSAQAAPAAASASEAGLAQFELQLQAIREAMLDSSVAAGTQVRSSAWIDAEGRLHENNQFVSQAQVRGVRVEAYLQPMVDAPSADEQARQAAQQAARRTAQARWRQIEQGDCEAPARWRVPVALVLHNGAPGDPLAASLLAEAERVLMAQSSPHLVLEPAQVGPELSAYERALLGAPSAAPLLRLALQVRPVAPVLAPPSPGAWLARLRPTGAAHEPPPTLAIGLRLLDASGASLWQAELALATNAQQRWQQPQAWQAQLERDLQAAAGIWWRDLGQHQACQSTRFVVETGADALQLAARAEHGVRPGDRFLVLDPALLPQRLLQDGAARQMALVEVSGIGPRGARLRQLAGPSLAPQGRWVAFPL